ncbi:MAG: hypothetical protein L7U72_13425, partial [Rubripirellula sp.]|nr:hypothetical protein [Rubripirellula sp.]
MRYSILLALLQASSLLIASRPAIGQDKAQFWNQFRGSGGDGIARTSILPVKFDESENLRWKVEVTDSGWSSPVVWENEIWLTTGSDTKKELRIYCIDLETGDLKKDIKVFDMIERKVDPAYTFDSPHLNSPA